VTARQRGLLHARCGELGLTDEVRHALTHCVTGQPHSDRVPRRLLGAEDPPAGLLGVLAVAKRSGITPEQLLGALREAYRENGGPLGENVDRLVAIIPDAAIPFDGGEADRS
jgi:hypothetical protein